MDTALRDSAVKVLNQISRDINSGEYVISPALALAVYRLKKAVVQRADVEDCGKILGAEFKVSPRRFENEKD